MLKLEITTHSSKDVDVLEVDAYDPIEINQKRNDNSLESILIGDNSYSRIDLKNIKVIE